MKATFEGVGGGGATGFHVVGDAGGFAAPGRSFMTEADKKRGEFLAIPLIEALNLLFDFQDAHDEKMFRRDGRVNGGAAGVNAPRCQPSQVASFSMMESRVGR